MGTLKKASNFFVNHIIEKSLMKKLTCFRKPEHLSFIDLIDTNIPYNFQNLYRMDTGLSDFHNTIVTV